MSLLLLLGCGSDPVGVAPGTGTSSTGSNDVSTTDESDTGPTAGSTGGTDSESPKAFCGDGVIDPTEECDDGNNSSNDGCSSTCEAEACGDGQVQGAEECDLGTDNSDDGTCTSACSINVCGDGLHGPGEGCDDGNSVPDDGCSPSCTLETCGNGRPEAGEACDDGNNDNDDGCTTLCTAPTCGDGLVSPSIGEDCDDGDTENADSCPNDCTRAVCGDEEVEGAEECDAGVANGDGVSLCTEDCRLNTCGDGYIVSAIEECDDWYENGTFHSNCTPFCTVNFCGDGYQHVATEACDLGELNGYAPCTTECESGQPGITEIEIAPDAACVLYSNGRVRCFGQPGDGQLGFPWPFTVGDEESEMPPPMLSLGGLVADLAGERGVGTRFCAARVDGAVVCWGSGQGPGQWEPDEVSYSGILGPMVEPEGGWGFGPYNIGDDAGEMPPEPIPLGPGNAIKVDIGADSACALFDDGGLRCWGQGYPDPLFETIGYGTLNHRWSPEHFPPPNVNIGAEVIDFVHAVNRTCTLAADGTVRCFGRSVSGLLGLGGTGPLPQGDTLQPPVPTDLGPPVVQLAGGNYTTCALGMDGGVRCFGSNAGWLGYALPGEDIGDELSEMPPATVDLGPDPIVQIVVSQYQACALSDQGDVRCWGGHWRTYGYGSFTDPVGHEPGDMPPPPLDLGGSAARLFAGAFQRFCALMQDDTLRCWGSSVFGSPGTQGGVGDQPGEMPPPRIRLYE